MRDLPRVLLVNPQMTSRRSARFPLSLLTLAGALSEKYLCRIVDGNVDRHYLTTLRLMLGEEDFAAVGVTAMGGPQIASAISVSRLVRERSPATPIIWGGYFPTLYPDAALNAPYVDFGVRGVGETTFAELLDALRDEPLGREPLGGARRGFESIAGLSWKRDGMVVRNPDRALTQPRETSEIPYHLLGNPRAYLARTFLGARTAAHQAGLGCRFRCTFCGVAALFRGATRLPPAARLERDLTWLKEGLGADSIQYFDHNFFDREADMIPLLEVMARIELPWWCYARADALLGLSSSSWTLIRRSRLRMAYIGAESPNDALLRSIRKGTTSNQTLEVAELCRHQGVIPELSFMVAPPDNTEEETERTFDFIREVKRVNPQAEIIIYIYTPLPAESLPPGPRARTTDPAPLHDLAGRPLRFPESPDEWTEQRWVDYACHADAPWLSDALRERIQDFVTVLGCRFPTVQDVRSPAWSKQVLRLLASWRYRYQRYGRPWELTLSKRVIRLADPRSTGI